MIPDIILALHFEAELGGYFDVTMNWYNQSGEYAKCAGFRMLEYPLLFFEYIKPWWLVKIR